MLKPAIAAKALNGDLLARVLGLRAILQRYLSNHQLAKKDIDILTKHSKGINLTGNWWKRMAGSIASNGSS